MSTNLALPLADWVPVSTNVFDLNGNFVASNALGADAPAAQFYVVRLQ